MTKVYISPETEVSTLAPRQLMALSEPVGVDKDSNAAEDPDGGRSTHRIWSDTDQWGGLTLQK